MSIKEEIALINKQTEQIKEINKAFDDEEKLEEYQEALESLNKAFEILTKVNYYIEEEMTLKQRIDTLKLDIKELKEIVVAERKQFEFLNSDEKERPVYDMYGKIDYETEGY
jgi:hypothetical protein